MSLEEEERSKRETYHGRRLVGVSEEVEDVKLLGRASSRSTLPGSTLMEGALSPELNGGAM